MTLRRVALGGYLGMTSRSRPSCGSDSLRHKWATGVTWSLWQFYLFIMMLLG